MHTPITLAGMALSSTRSHGARHHRNTIDRGEFAIFDPSETMSRHAFYWWDKE